MKYQLVIQFRGSSLADYDSLISLESQLIEALGDSGGIDGHDCGSGEANIFIITSNPAATFHRARPVLERTLHLQSILAAYRQINDERYTVLWPAGLEIERDFRVG